MLFRSQTPAHLLDPKLILTDLILDRKREIIRKIGIERVCTKLHTTTLEEKGDYKLITLRTDNTRRSRDNEYLYPEIGPFLLMKNPSIGIYHIEGVAPHIKTIQEAINWRAGNTDIDWIPTQLT